MMRALLVSLLAVWWMTAGPALGQTAAPADGALGSTPTVADLEARVKAVEADAKLDDLGRQAVVTPLQEAIQLLGEAGKLSARRDEFEASLKAGPARTEQVRAELKALQEAGPGAELPEGVGPQSSTREVEAVLRREKAALSALQTELQSHQAELATIEKRAAAIGERQVTAKAELDEAGRNLVALNSGEGGDDDQLSQARRARLEALQEKLKVELAMLEREDASDETRRATAEATRDLAVAKIELAGKRVAALQELGASMVKDKVRGARDVAATIEERLPDPPAALRQLLDESMRLSAETDRLAGAIAGAEAELRSRQDELGRMDAAFASLKRQSELGGQESSLGRALMAQLRLLPSPHDIRQDLVQTEAELAGARSNQFALERALRIEAEAGQAVTAESLMAEGVPKELSGSIASLQQMDGQLRQDLKAGYKRLIQTLSEQLTAERQIQATRGQFTAFANEKLLLVRTSPVLGADTLQSLPESLGEVYGPQRLGEFWNRLWSAPLGFWIVLLLLVGALLFLRPVLGRILQRAGHQTRRLSTDRYRDTMAALAATLLLAAPAPMIAVALGVALRWQPNVSAWSYALGGGLIGIWFFLLKVAVLIVACRPGGLGEMHLQWSAGVTGRLRRLSWWWIAAFVPCELTIRIVLGEPQVPHLDDVGRVAGMLMTLGVGTVIALIMHPSKGLAWDVHQRNAGSLFGRLRVVWFVLVAGVIVGVTVLFVSGHLFAGVLVLEHVVKSLTAVVVAFLGYGLVLRWFAMRERRIAVEERLAERQARREELERQGGAEGEALGASGEEAHLPEVTEEEPMNIATVGEQTRNLLGFTAGVLLLWRLVAIWSGFSPMVGVLDGFTVLWGLSIADIGMIILVIAGLVAVLRNLPGLLEVVVLRRLDLDAGTRTAMTTLAKYAVIAIGAAFLFQTIGLDWSRFGWIAAALSVGLGFGLQEVVANFVCGIILLFERPVRVGDVVTVDGIDGTVSRIQIRATTITNWDRKDFIVPNKQFVTGTLMNWTLSGGLNRFLIKVGVAYGSDVERVREVLAEVVVGHPDLLEDPAPVVTLENFGDSSLDFVIRCYLPNLDRRVLVIHELHTAIYQRLAAEGIEIPFPQRDLHIRSGGGPESS